MECARKKSSGYTRFNLTHNIQYKVYSSAALHRAAQHCMLTCFRASMKQCVRARKRYLQRRVSHETMRNNRLPLRFRSSSRNELRMEGGGFARALYVKYCACDVNCIHVMPHCITGACLACATDVHNCPSARRHDLCAPRAPQLIASTPTSRPRNDAATAAAAAVQQRLCNRKVPALGVAAAPRQAPAVAAIGARRLLMCYW